MPRGGCLRPETSWDQSCRFQHHCGRKHPPRIGNVKYIMGTSVSLPLHHDSSIMYAATTAGSVQHEAHVELIQVSDLTASLARSELMKKN
eukprot:gene15458-biopygen447